MAVRSGLDPKRAVVLCALCASFCVHADRAVAGALDNSFVGARAIAMGGAFTGIANDASAVYYNPAGLGFLAPRATRAEASGYLSLTEFTYENAGSVFESHEKPIVPGLFAAHRFDRFALGFGYYIPYGGGGTAYQDFLGTGVELKSAAGVQAFTAAAAYKLTKRLSAGAGVSMFVGVVDTRAPQAISQPVPAIVDYESEYNGRSGYGWNLGVLYQATDSLSVGLGAISASSVRMDGEEHASIPALGVETTNDSQIELGVPWYFTAGVGYRPHPGLTLGLSACWMNWSAQPEVVIGHDGAGAATAVTTHYKDSFRASVGLEYAASRKLVLRGGLKYQPGATEDDHLVPTANDVDLLVPSVGVGYRIGSALQLDLAAFFVIGQRTSHGQESFDQDHVMLVVGLRWGS